MTQKNEMSARALGMEELEMVNGGGGRRSHGGGHWVMHVEDPSSLKSRIKNGLGYVWWSITH